MQLQSPAGILAETSNLFNTDCSNIEIGVLSDMINVLLSVMPNLLEKQCLKEAYETFVACFGQPLQNLAIPSLFAGKQS